MTLKQQIGLSSSPKELSAVFMAVVADNDQESVFTIIGPAGERVPVVAIDQAGLDTLSQYARENADRTGRPISIISFTERAHHATFVPNTTNDKGMP